MKLPACRLALLFVALLLPAARAQQDQVPANPITLTTVGRDQTKATQIADNIYQAIGWSNTLMVTTPAGNVIIDTSLAPNAALHTKLLRAASSAPVKYIILTHAHGDHTGGVTAWKQIGGADTQIIAQREHVDFMHYLARLNGFYGIRNAAQFAFPMPAAAPAWPGNAGGKIEPTILFDDKYEFELGGLKFIVMSTPGETYDHASVWLPQLKAVFVGDNYYDSFPNIYTLRGTQPRWALDYVNSLNKVLALKPELLIPSHGMAIKGNAEITRRVTRYRDAIQYVHDETVKGMNAGKSVWTLMNEIKLPTALDIGESYGKLSWSVRGIYEGYVGYFDLNPATMYETPVTAVYADVIKLAGGPDAIAKLAMTRADAGQAIEALHLSEMALTVDGKHPTALQVKLKALETLRARCKNSNERGWLDFSINTLKAKLEGSRTK